MNEKLAPAETSNQSPSISLDDVDKKIISLVQLDGRRSYASIGRELDISEGTVRVRVNQLTSANILRFIAVVDPMEIGYKAWDNTPHQCGISHYYILVSCLRQVILINN